MGRDYRKKGDAGRDGGGFAAIPWAVFDSPAYARLGHPAKALLLEFARQFVRDNNGKLLCSMAHLRPRGWKSADVVHRAKSELLAAGFIFETCKGQRPNRASWYAITWRALDRNHGYDHGAVESFERGAYRKNASLIPSPGIEVTPIVPSPGIEKASPIPSPGAMKATFAPSSIPSPGNHLEKPSVGAQVTAPTAQQTAHETLARLWQAIGGNHAKLWHLSANGPAIGVSAPMHCAA
ncbi:hypothetical protein [Diaphorobacter nitroreducens]|uniref:hypothetical protein n=1 Tax=Diaphorobacter nitroreducens TaxID=164759 RepID=UPI0000DC9312|nr:hypothetical protein [Diaphorobacter nitroreducens]ABM41920.1 hypothetical protein Ajs_1730 [Acidovorax sp. JS42]